MIEYIDADEFEKLKEQFENSVSQLSYFMDENIKREPLTALAKVDLMQFKKLVDKVRIEVDYLKKIKKIR